jgi:hypothetical protein
MGCCIRIQHPTILVAQDLREIMMLLGAGQVEIVRCGSRPETVLRPDATILGASERDLSDPAFLAAAAQGPGITILVSFHAPRPPDLPPKVFLLSEPFRTEDVREVLRTAGLLRCR